MTVLSLTCESHTWKDGIFVFKRMPNATAKSILDVYAAMQDHLLQMIWYVFRKISHLSMFWCYAQNDYMGSFHKELMSSFSNSGEDSLCYFW